MIWGLLSVAGSEMSSSTSEDCDCSEAACLTEQISCAKSEVWQLPPRYHKKHRKSHGNSTCQCKIPISALHLSRHPKRLRWRRWPSTSAQAVCPSFEAPWTTGAWRKFKNRKTSNPLAINRSTDRSLIAAGLFWKISSNKTTSTTSLSSLSCAWCAA